MLRDLAAQLPLIDHHCHGVVLDDLDQRGFEALISESYAPPPAGTSQFQKPVGLVIRRFCAPLLDLDPWAPAEDYVARRRALGVAEVNRRLLRACGLERLLIDTGHRADTIADVPAMAGIAATPAHEVVRLEALAEEVAGSGVDAAGYPAAFADALQNRAADAVGLKSIVAYRTSFAIEQTPPSDAELMSALDDWLAEIAATGKVRLADATIIRHGLFVGADYCRQRGGLPLQLHVGFGDPDIVMHACDPSHFTDFFKALEPWGVPVTLLHCYPFHREAGWLSEIFQNVYFDVGAILNYTGPSSVRILAEALEMGPFTKQLYSSDAFGLPELFYLGAVLFRRAIHKVLDEWIADDLCTLPEAERIVRLIGVENARRIYPIGDT